MTHRTYEPAWVTEAAFELEQLLSAPVTSDHDCGYYTRDGVCMYCLQEVSADAG